MQSSSMSCYGGGSTATLGSSAWNYYSEESAQMSGFSARGTFLEVPGQSSRIKEREDTLSALRETAPRLATMSAASDNDRRRMLMPLRARSSLRSIRSATSPNKGSMTTSAVHLTANTTSPSIVTDTYTHTMQPKHQIAELRVERPSSISKKAPEQEVQKPKKRSGIKSMFSFASFSKHSSRNSVDTTKSDEEASQAPSPTRAVNEWMAIQNNELIRASSSSIGSGSRSSSSVLKIPNARRATNSVVSSQQSTGDRLSTSSRSSSYTRVFPRITGPQRANSRTPSPETQTIDEGHEAELAKPIKAPLINDERASSPSPSRHTRGPSDVSIQDDVVICDAAATSFFSAGRPKSIYEYRVPQEPAASNTAYTTIRQKSIKFLNAQRPRPHVLQLASKATQVETSPSSASSSAPSLTSSYTPMSTSPPSTPGSPSTTFQSPYSKQRSPDYPYLGDESSSNKSTTSTSSRSSSSSSPPLPILPPRQSSLSPFTTTMLKAAAHNRTTTIARQPTQRSQNPYTTTPTAPFPSPSTSPASATSPPGATYFRLPQTSSAHPSLYPDLLVKDRDGKTVGMDLTEEEAVLIASLRRKRMAMRREELEKLGKALGVNREEGGGRGLGS